MIVRKEAVLKLLRALLYTSRRGFYRLLMFAKPMM